jgi:hypothetical protein
VKLREEEVEHDLRIFFIKQILNIQFYFLVLEIIFPHFWVTSLSYLFTGKQLKKVKWILACFHLLFTSIYVLRSFLSSTNKKYVPVPRLARVPVNKGSCSTHKHKLGRDLPTGHKGEGADEGYCSQSSIQPDQWWYTKCVEDYIVISVEIMNK